MATTVTVTGGSTQYMPQASYAMTATVARGTTGAAQTVTAIGITCDTVGVRFSSTDAFLSQTISATGATGSLAITFNAFVADTNPKYSVAASSGTPPVPGATSLATFAPVVTVSVVTSDSATPVTGTGALTVTQVKQPLTDTTY